MSLTRDTAQQIVAAVRRDSACQLQINSWLRRLPAGWGVSGTLRNLGRFVTLQDPSEDRIAREACTGIAIATVNAIEHQLASGGIPDVASVERLDRFSPNHTATKINMRDGTSYVFDWHATLNVRNPLIYTETAWLHRSQRGTQFVHFQGISPIAPPPTEAHQRRFLQHAKSFHRAGGSPPED